VQGGELDIGGHERGKVSGHDLLAGRQAADEEFFFGKNVSIFNIFEKN